MKTAQGNLIAWSNQWFQAFGSAGGESPTDEEDSQPIFIPMEILYSPLQSARNDNSQCVRSGKTTGVESQPVAKPRNMDDQQFDQRSTVIEERVNCFETPPTVKRALENDSKITAEDTARSPKRLCTDSHRCRESKCLSTPESDNAKSHQLDRLHRKLFQSNSKYVLVRSTGPTSCAYWQRLPNS